MARYLHHVRQGETNEQRRDLQVNGMARAIGPWQGVHAAFVAPVLADEPGATDAYTGFAADGQWYEHGRRAPATLGEALGNATCDFNTRKWQLTQSTMQWSQTGAAFVLESKTGGVRVLDVRSRCELRGDFHIRLMVPATHMGQGIGAGAGEDDALWFGVRQVTEGATFYAKHTRNKTGVNDDGFAAEVSTLGHMINYQAVPVADGGAFVLIAKRTAGILRLSFSAGADPFELWAGACPGRVTVGWGARSVDPTSPDWTASVSEFVHVSGWHDYTNRASWANERPVGMLFDEFVGDELDTRLWTVDAPGSGSATPGVEDGKKLRLKVQNGGRAAVKLATITGDFTLRCAATNTMLAQGDPGVTNTLFAVDIITLDSVGNEPVMAVQVESELQDGGVGQPDILTARAVLKYYDGSATMTLASGELAEAAAPAVAVTVERRGRLFLVAVDDLHSGARLLTYTTDDDVMPTAPLHAALRASSPGSSVSFETVVPSVRVTSPHALRLDAWPGDYFGGGALAAHSEVSRYAGKDAYPALGQLTLIGVAEERAPFWRIVGCQNNETGQGLQALPGGAVGDVWADPEAGRLVIPVARDGADPEAEGGFVFVDLAQDRIYLRRGGDGFEFGGPVGWRHFGLGYSATTGMSGPDAPPVGQAIGYAEVAAGGTVDGPLVVWTTREQIRIYEPEAGSGTNILRNADEEADGATFIYRTVAVPPPSPSAGKTASLVALVRRRGDLAVAIYRNALAHLDDGDEPTPGAWADAIYTGDDPDPLNVGFVAGKLVGDAAMPEGETPDVHAVRPAAAGAAGLVLFAVARKAGASVTQDAATPADAPFNEWLALGVSQSISDGPPPPPQQIDTSTRVYGYGVAVRLTPDACSIVGSRAGFVVVGTGSLISAGFFSFYLGGFDMIPLTTMKVRTRVTTSQIGAEFVGKDPRATTQGLTLLYPPPGLVGGVRVCFGLSTAALGIVEYDALAVTGGPWRGPHIGGTRLAIQGWGLDEVVEVLVGGVGCFRLALDVRPEMPVLYAVNRALGFIEHPETGPIMSDDELADTAEWPKDVLLRWRDGSEMVLESAFVYESRLAIEHHLARLMSRLPPALDNDPKADWPQRHIFVAAAFLLWRMAERFFAPLEADTYAETGTGDGLRHLAGSYGASAPYEGMSDAQVRAWIHARVGGARVTRKAVLDLLEPILGVRPTMTEGYREFTIHVGNLPNLNVGAGLRNFWGDTDDADRATGAYFDRDFWGGDDARIVAARRVLNVLRAAGVRANLVLESAP